MKKVLIFFVNVILIVGFILSINKICVVSAKEQFDDISARSYIVIDSSENVLLSKNPDEKMEVASICKLMTTLLTLEQIDSGLFSLNDKVVASKYACDAEGSQAFLDSGSEYSIRDLLKSVIVASANDSAIVLAEAIGGSENNFVKMMNARAKDLGMENTLYANSTGLPQDTQYSTARDTAKLLGAVSEYQIYREDCQIWMDKLVHPSGRETELVNTNRLIKYYPNCITGKTGFTDEAGYCLSSTAEKNNFHLTCVVLGCEKMSDRFTDSIELYNYTFANFACEKMVDKDKLVDNSIIVIRGKEDSIDIRPSQDYFVTKNRNDSSTYDISYDFWDKQSAPIRVGDEVGKMYIKKDGEVIKEIPLVSDTNVDRQNYGDIIDKIITKFGFF